MSTIAVGASGVIIITCNASPGDNQTASCGTVVSAFATRFFEETGVAISPGIDFCNQRSKQHVRLACTTSMDNSKEGIHGLQGFL